MSLKKNDLKVKIIFPASMKNVGLLYHFTNLSIELAKVFRDTEYSFLMISEKGEQNNNLWKEINRELKPDEFQICDNYKDFTSIYKKYLCDDNFSKVIVLTQGIMQVVESIKLKKQFPNKLILYTRLNSFKHGSLFRVPLTFFLSFIYEKYCDVVNFQCDFTYSIFFNSKRIVNKGKAITIPLGLSVENIKAAQDVEILKHFQDKDTFKIIYLAQLHKHKNHAQIIKKIVPLLREKRNVRVFFLGRGSELENLKKLVSVYDLNHQIFFLGRIERSFVPWVVKSSDLALALSNTETFGHVILEPLFYGIPVVSRNVGIANDVIKDLDNGFVIRDKDLKNLNLVLSYFINRNRKNTKLELSYYTWGEIAKTYKSLVDYLVLKSESFE